MAFRGHFTHDERRLPILSVEEMLDNELDKLLLVFEDMNQLDIVKLLNKKDQRTLEHVLQRVLHQWLMLLSHLLSQLSNLLIKQLDQRLDQDHNRLDH